MGPNVRINVQLGLLDHKAVSESRLISAGAHYTGRSRFEVRHDEMPDIVRSY